MLQCVPTSDEVVKVKKKLDEIIPEQVKESNNNSVNNTTETNNTDSDTINDSVNVTDEDKINSNKTKSLDINEFIKIPVRGKSCRHY
jgi:hypothetical protein